MGPPCVRGRDRSASALKPFLHPAVTALYAMRPDNPGAWSTTALRCDSARSSSPTCTSARPAARPRTCWSSAPHESDHLYLVGDIVDGWQMRRRWYWHQSHNDVVQKVLRKARKDTRVTYIAGNHDEALRRFLGVAFGGIEIRDEAVRDRR